MTLTIRAIMSKPASVINQIRQREEQAAFEQSSKSIDRASLFKDGTVARYDDDNSMLKKLEVSKKNISFAQDIVQKQISTLKSIEEVVIELQNTAQKPDGSEASRTEAMKELGEKLETLLKTTDISGSFVVNGTKIDPLSRLDSNNQRVYSSFAQLKKDPNISDVISENGIISIRENDTSKLYHMMGGEYVNALAEYYIAARDYDINKVDSSEKLLQAAKTKLDTLKNQINVGLTVADKEIKESQTLVDDNEKIVTTRLEQFTKSKTDMLDQFEHTHSNAQSTLASMQMIKLQRSMEKMLLQIAS